MLSKARRKIKQKINKINKINKIEIENNRENQHHQELFLPTQINKTDI